MPTRALTAVTPAAAQAINYSSRLEGFATQHWSSSQRKRIREEDVEAAADEPLLGTLPTKCASSPDIEN